jgi:hypothetical protein
LGWIFEGDGGEHFGQERGIDFDKKDYRQRDMEQFSGNTKKGLFEHAFGHGRHCTINEPF